MLQVVFDTPLRRRFDYLPPADGPVPAPGARVRAPLGRRTAVGVVAAVADHSELPRSRLKRLTGVLDPAPLWDPVTFALLLWAADYYHHPAGEVLFAAMPAALRAGRPAWQPDLSWRLSPAGHAALATGPRLGSRQRELLQLVAAGAAAAAITSAGLAATLRDLARRGWLESVEHAPPVPDAGTGSAGPELNAAQAQACAAIATAPGGYAAWLLHGVTGSGKTEVYLRLIERVLTGGGQVLVLVPEIALTPQLLARFRERLPVPVVALHSSLGDGERLAGWRAAASGAAPVVIGTRSAVFTPLPALALVVVDEEHDPSLKQQEGFRYSARDLAVARAQRQGVPVVLGSATPSLESLANVASGRYRRLELPDRTNQAGQPRLSLIDLRHHACRDGIAQPALAAMERHLGAGGQVLVYLNRRGWAPTLFCPGCGWVAPCRACDARLTVHLRAARLRCHHCGAEERLPFACARCGNEVRPVGEGTERLEATLGELFPGVPLARIDRDVIRRRGDIERALEAVASGRARILLGTQMLTKGHDFPAVTLVVVLSADQGLFGADFRASERLAQQIVQVAGRAGRGDRAGEVLIQSAFPEHPLLVSLITEGYTGFARRALDERRAAGWPPWSHLALLCADGPARDEVYAFLRAARELAPVTGRLRLLGPAPAAMERRAGRHRARLLLESPSRAPLQQLLSRWLPALEGLRRPRGLRWAMDVDPLEVD
ncbi:MAG: primosomal protein N' [Gammaproteobacteria bacterium]|nr:primosomal protein N' [Gammaproteobacteria bacterium]